MKVSLKKYLLCIAILSNTALLLAQQNHFIYLQTENKQPFYVKLNKKVLSSSAAGYLIIPRLNEGAHNLVVGFPKNEWPEQTITCNISKTDAGYILKNFGEKGWGLFNWQSLAVVMGTKNDGEQTAMATSKTTQQDTLANTADANNTPPATTKNPVIKNQELPVPPSTVTPQNTEAIKPVVNIVKLLSANATSGMELIYMDGSNGMPDTVRIFIPIEKEQQALNESSSKPGIPAQAVTEIPQPVNKPSEEKETDNNKKADTIPNPAVSQTSSSVAPTKPVIPNSDCKATASEEDFLKLRKKMAAEENDDDMVTTARKTFKAKCFTVQQVKNLSMLFLNDNGKYKFFDAAYPFVSDSYNFNTLATLLTDDYYKNRFNAMLRH